MAARLLQHHASPSHPERDEPVTVYLKRAREARDRERALSRRSDAIARGRLWVFLGFVAALVAGRFVPPGLGLSARVLAGGLAGVFFWLVYRHAGARRAVTWEAQLARVSDQAASRLKRAWDDLDQPRVEVPETHPFADDLDLFGHASLLGLLGAVGTRPGIETLRDWMLEPAAPQEIVARQEAVAELTPMLDFRDGLTAHGRQIGPVSVEELESLLAWAEEPGWLLERTALRVLSWLLPALTAVFIAAHALGVMGYLWLAPLAATLWVMRSTGARIRADFTRLSSGDSGLRRYGELVEEVAARDFGARLLADLRDGLAEGGEPPPAALHRLFRRIELSDLRFSDLHVPVNLFTLWDLHVLASLERWKARNGADLRAWLECLGRADALSAVASLAHAHPTWVFPSVGQSAEPVFAAKDLGHPLLPPTRCVRNDVAVGPPDTFLLVTGSNMSGKSTLLRAVGLNAVLAGMGAPACATELRLPPVELRTSMRIRDSLEEGVSYFMAELRRLKGVVDAADERRDPRSGRLLYLLDEILLGTNTAERQIAARRVLRHLLASGAIGAVTTHDLTLADADDLRARAHAVHFREAVGKEGSDAVVAFDYRLREGIATSTNALKLMRAIGLNGGEL